MRYDKEGRLSSVEVSGDPAAVHQVLGQLLRLNQAPHSPAPSQAPERPAPEPQPEPKQANGKRARRAQQAQPQRAEARQEGLPEFARDNPWLPLLASRAKQS